MGSHRRLAPSGPVRSAGAARVAMGALSAAAAALAAVPDTPALAAPRDDTRAEVDRLYTEAEKATEAYNAADERADRLRGQVNDAQDRVARQQERVNSLRDALGSLAGAQYRTGGLDPSLALLFSADPDDYLDRAAVLHRIGVQQAGRLGQLQDALRDLGRERAEVAGRLTELEKNRRAAAAHKRAVEDKLARARRLLAALPDAERAAFERASRFARQDLPDVADLPPASPRAAVAVAAARSALGKPYAWGATGPGAFDCSGLMQWSYAHAGVALPRTSQAQRAAGRRIPLSEARPGDLVTYRSDASHIGMYVGGGQVIHAPYPGAPVRHDPVGMMPISGVTRV